jgi:hypothetical protein
MTTKPRKKTPTGSDQVLLASADELPERWSVQRKAELVLRLLRGEALDAVSRESRSRRTSWKHGSERSWRPVRAV